MKINITLGWSRILAILLLCILCISCSEHSRRENKLPPEAATALHTPEKVILYSLEPEGPPDPPTNTFQHYSLLGQTTLEGAPAATAVSAFESAILPYWPRNSSTCFDPRHALRVTSQGHTYDFILCYACGGMKVYRDDTYFASVAAGGSPAVLNGLLTAAKIPLATPPPSERK